LTATSTDCLKQDCSAIFEIITLSQLIAYAVVRAMREVNGGGSYSAPWGSKTPEPIQLKFDVFESFHRSTSYAK